jgi:DNA-directed RNA polymerase specialized sigma24 family protein
MSLAAEAFVVTLSRASARGHRYLRGLKPPDRDDVISAAILTCWEQRETFNAETQTLDDWFMDALRKARQAVRKGHRTTSIQLSSELAGPDNTARAVETQDAVEKVLSQLNPREFRILKLQVKGYSTRDIVRRAPHYRASEVHRLNRKMKQLRDLIPDTREIERYIRPRQESDDVPRIDVEIERLDFAPLNGKDCPPCWRCMYFYGMRPVRYKPTRLADPELERAVQDTEARKITIATQR